MKRFQGGLACKAHRLFYHSALGLRGIKLKGLEFRAGRVARIVFFFFITLGLEMSDAKVYEP